MKHGAGSDPDAVERFGQVYALNYSRLVGYAMRRAASRDDAADIVAETFLVAWRDLARVPAGDAATLPSRTAARLRAPHVRRACLG